MYNPRGFSLSALFTVWVEELLGRFLCAIGRHHERRLHREDSYEQDWQTGVCDRCGRRI